MTTKSFLPVALIALAGSLPLSLHAQTEFSPKYTPFNDDGGLINSGMPVLQQDFNNDGIPDVMNGEYPTVEMLSTGAGNYKVTANGGGPVVLLRQESNEVPLSGLWQWHRRIQ